MAEASPKNDRSVSSLRAALAAWQSMQRHKLSCVPAMDCFVASAPRNDGTRGVDGFGASGNGNPGVTRRGALVGLAAAGLLGAVERARAAEGKRGGTVTMVMPSEPPALLSFVNSSSIALSGRSTEGLLTYDFDMNPQPCLATSWAVEDGGLRYIFKLRRGVKWHDGQDFTADDVAFSIATVKKLHPRGRSTFAHVVDIATPDAETVVLRLDKPTAYLIKALTGMETAIVPKHVYGDADPLTHRNNVAPIGTGPYVFKEWVRGSYVLWERNPNYWDAPFPLIDRLVAKFIPDASARTIAYESGDVDLGYRTPVPYRDVARLQKLPKIAMETKGYEYDPPNIVIVEANLNQDDLKKLPVRQAIAHCIDRDALARIVFFGQALPSPTAVVPFHKLFHSTKPSPYPYDLKAAEKLLDDAGYHRDGTAPRLKLMLDYTGEDQRPVAEFLRATFSRAGIALELRTQDMGTLVKRVYTDRDFNLHLASISNLFDPNVGVQRLYWSKNYITGVPFSNGTHYANPEVDALLEGAATETDTDKRVAMWMRVQDIVMTDVPNFPLVMAYWQTIAQSKVKDHTVTAEGFEGSLSKMWIDA